MTAAINGQARASESLEPNAMLVSDIYRRVGELLAEANTRSEAAGRGRLAVDDERALSQKLIADELSSLAERAYAGGAEPLDEAAEDAVTVAVLDRLHGLARLQPLLDDRPRRVQVAQRDRHVVVPQRRA